MARPKVVVVGGGLAGLVAAWKLLERGCDVTIFEASGRWGGKAGATEWDGQFEEHGYHIFPGWYRNIWQIIDELGLRESFRDCSQFLQLRPGTYPDFRAFTNITSARYLWRNLTAGVLPFAETFLFFYAALDLISQPYRYRAQLDQVTVTGFLRSRFYRTESIAQQFQELMLKGISVPTYEVSAMTMHKVMQLWVTTPVPMHRILRGNLQSMWIEPIRKKVASLGGALRLGQKLEAIEAVGGVVTSLRLTDQHGSRDNHPVEHVLLAIPVEKVIELVGDDLYSSAPALGELRHVRTQAMTAFNVYFKGKIANMPSAHVNCLDSRYGISFIDVSQTWEIPDRTVLNLIASDVTDLESVSPSVAVAALMDDLRRYLPPFDVADVERITFQSHKKQPLFMNDVGNWQFRPSARTQVHNLFLAGDYCQTPVDLVSMEGAVCSGLAAAEALRADLGIGWPISVLSPETYPRWLFVLGRMVLLPAAAIAKLWTFFTPSTFEPSASNVPPFRLNARPNWPVTVVDESVPPSDVE